jgi:hypothetical protein
MRNVKEFEYILDDFHNQLKLSVVICMDSCYQLLGSLNLPADQLNALLVQQKKDAWSDKTLQKAIGSKLGANYNTYRSAVEKLEEKIALLCRKLKLDEDFKASRLLDPRCTP